MVGWLWYTMTEDDMIRPYKTIDEFHEKMMEYAQLLRDGEIHKIPDWRLKKFKLSMKVHGENLNLYYRDLCLKIVKAREKFPDAKKVS